MGRKHALPILMVAAGAIVLFVTVEPRQGRATVQDAPPEPAMPLGSLEGRDHGVRIEVTQDGPRYTVVDALGVVVAERLPLEILAERYPHLAPGDLWAEESGEGLGPLMVIPDAGMN